MAPQVLMQARSNQKIHSKKGGSTAGLIQAAVAEEDPAQAAKWRVAAGKCLSMATMAEL